MSNITRILCPMDFDHNSVAALRIARRLSQENRAKLYVIHVVPPVAPLAISAPAIAHRSEEQSRTHLAEIERDELAAVDHENGAPVWPSGRRGDRRGSGIQDRGHRDGDAWPYRRVTPLLGSVAEKVVREAPCLVITVNPNAMRQQESPPQKVAARS